MKCLKYHLLVQDLVLAVLVEKEPIKLAPNSAQIPALLAQTKQNIFHLKPHQTPAPQQQQQQPPALQAAITAPPGGQPAADGAVAAPAENSDMPASSAQQPPAPDASQAVPKTEPGTDLQQQVGLHCRFIGGHSRVCCCLEF